MDPSLTDQAPQGPLRPLWRLVASYLFLYSLPFPLTLITAQASPWSFWDPVAVFLGRVLIGNEIPTHPGPDALVKYLGLAVLLGVAVLLTLLWTAVERKADLDAKMTLWLPIWLRFYLAGFLFFYAAFKIIPVHVPTLDAAALMTSYGDQSPMGLASNFFGYGRIYALFTGLGELSVAVLLCWRRTASAAALLGLLALGHGVALNLTMDGALKITSLHFMLICAFLLIGDRRRLNALVFSLDATPAQTLKPLFQNPRAGKIATLLAGAVMVAVAGFQFYAAVTTYNQRYAQPPTALDGVYRVTTVDQGQGPRPVTSTDRNLWHTFVVAKGGQAGAVKRVDGKVSRRTFQIDERQQSIRQMNPYQSKPDQAAFEKSDTPRELFTHAVDWPAATLHYWWSAEQQLNLFVPTANDSHLVYTLEKIEPTSFLAERGFNWINEGPINN